ncbi:aquaporin-like protein [Acrodontium crateriforme]|uniref:Aquaporin-like protein n=1 Tax=Acrodontium crateriforme TaxID=150365 RepID=A0AAQ3M7G9_9PEZI|nr:aquaporin-like protein [Acrodontium crateriforme]
MEGPNNSRPRARSDVTRPEHSEAGRARSATTSARPDAALFQIPNVEGPAQSPQREAIRSPQREPRLSLQRTTSQLRRRQTGLTTITRETRRSNRSNFNLAGLDDSSALRQAHENYVNPGYVDLNPAYDQPANSKPVWSLAKPLPRVVRGGMVPTKQEIIENRVKPELPAENSQKVGLNVDPNDLEAGNFEPTVNPTKIAAQVADARAQRENNFLNNLQRRGTIRLSGETSRLPGGRRRGSTLSALPDGGVEDQERRTSTSHDEESLPFPRPPHRPTDLQPIEERPEASRAQSLNSDETASITTLGVDDGSNPDEFMIPLMDQYDNEIHNVHTVWSVYRIKHREFLAELLGVVVQLTMGFCSDLSVQIADKGNPNTTAWAWGFATMIAIYVSGGISGAHLNPVITIILYFYRGFPRSKMPAYFLAQFLGAFIAAFIAYGLYFASIHEYLSTNQGPALDIMNSFVTSQRESWIDTTTAFFNEFVGTAMLVIAVLSLGDDQNAPPGAGMNAFIIGLVVTVQNFAFAFQTGIAANPSRDFGPRLALLALGYDKKLFTNPFWFYGPFAGTLLGGFTGGLLYDVLVFTGGESPINYPWGRTKRAMHKSRVKWERRLHLASEGEKEKVVS